MSSDEKLTAQEINETARLNSEIAVQALFPLLERLIEELTRSKSIPDTFIADALAEMEKFADFADKKYPHVSNPSRPIVDWLAEVHDVNQQHSGS